MNSDPGNQRRLVARLTKTGAWFAVSRSTRIAAGVWITRRLHPQDFAQLAVIFALPR
jgi:hypothetical protein